MESEGKEVDTESEGSEPEGENLIGVFGQLRYRCRGRDHACKE